MPSSYFNLWRGPDYAATYGESHLDFVDFVTHKLRGDPGAVEYLFSFFATLRQRPGTRIRHHLQLWSNAEQVGKSLTLRNLWCAAIGNETREPYDLRPLMICKLSHAHMDSQFVYWTDKCVLLVVSEDNDGFRAFRSRLPRTKGSEA